MQSYKSRAAFKLLQVGLSHVLLEELVLIVSRWIPSTSSSSGGRQS